MNLEKNGFNITKKESLLFEYMEKFSDRNEISLEDLVEMKEKGVTTEDLLNFIGTKSNFLFHGSRVELSEDDKITSDKNKGDLVSFNCSLNEKFMFNWIPTYL